MPRIAPRRKVTPYLAEWRKHRGLTQQQLADRLGCEVMTVSRWELHKVGVTTDTLAALAEALGGELDLIDLFYHPDSPKRLEEQTPSKSRQPRRPHFIAEWGARRNLTQGQLANILGADKSVIYRW